MQVVSGKELRQRIDKKHSQIFRLRAEMGAHRNWSDPWMRRRATIKRLRADIATLEIMLKQLEPGQDASP